MIFLSFLVRFASFFPDHLHIQFTRWIMRSVPTPSWWRTNRIFPRAQITAMTTIYHNPQCSKSRQTLQLLKEHGTEPTVVEYLKTPPDEQTLREILQLLNMRPIDLVRQKEALFTELNLAAQKDDDQVILKAMLKHPRLIERPIVIHGNKAAIGRPPQNVVDLL